MLNQCDIMSVPSGSADLPMIHSLTHENYLHRLHSTANTILLHHPLYTDQLRQLHVLENNTLDALILLYIQSNLTDDLIRALTVTTYNSHTNTVQYVYNDIPLFIQSLDVLYHQLAHTASNSNDVDVLERCAIQSNALFTLYNTLLQYRIINQQTQSTVQQTVQVLQYISNVISTSIWLIQNRSKIQLDGQQLSSTSTYKQQKCYGIRDQLFFIGLNCTDITVDHRDSTFIKVLCASANVSCASIDQLVHSIRCINQHTDIDNASITSQLIRYIVLYILLHNNNPDLIEQYIVHGNIPSVELQFATLLIQLDTLYENEFQSDNPLITHSIQHSLISPTMSSLLIQHSLVDNVLLTLYNYEKYYIITQVVNSIQLNHPTTELSYLTTILYINSLSITNNYIALHQYLHKQSQQLKVYYFTNIIYTISNVYNILKLSWANNDLLLLHNCIIQSQHIRSIELLIIYHLKHYNIDIAQQLYQQHNNNEFELITAELMRQYNLVQINDGTNQSLVNTNQLHYNKLINELYHHAEQVKIDKLNTAGTEPQPTDDDINAPFDIISSCQTVDDHMGDEIKHEDVTDDDREYVVVDSRYGDSSSDISSGVDSDIELINDDGVDVVLIDSNDNVGYESQFIVHNSNDNTLVDHDHIVDNIHDNDKTENEKTHDSGVVERDNVFNDIIDEPLNNRQSDVTPTAESIQTIELTDDKVPIVPVQQHEPIQHSLDTSIPVYIEFVDSMEQSTDDLDESIHPSTIESPLSVATHDTDSSSITSIHIPPPAADVYINDAPTNTNTDSYDDNNQLIPEQPIIAAVGDHPPIQHNDINDTSEPSESDRAVITDTNNDSMDMINDADNTLDTSDNTMSTIDVEIANDKSIVLSDQTTTPTNSSSDTTTSATYNLRHTSPVQYSPVKRTPRRKTSPPKKLSPSTDTIVSTTSTSKRTTRSKNDGMEQNNDSITNKPMINKSSIDDDTVFAKPTALRTRVSKSDTTNTDTIDNTPSKRTRNTANKKKIDESGVSINDDTPSKRTTRGTTTAVSQPTESGTLDDTPSKRTRTKQSSINNNLSQTLPIRQSARISSPNKNILSDATTSNTTIVILPVNESTPPKRIRKSTPHKKNTIHTEVVVSPQSSPNTTNDILSSPAPFVPKQAGHTPYNKLRKPITKQSLHNTIKSNTISHNEFIVPSKLRTTRNTTTTTTRNATPRPSKMKQSISNNLPISNTTTTTTTATSHKNNTDNRSVPFDVTPNKQNTRKK